MSKLNIGGAASRGSLFMGLLCTFSVSLFDSFESTTFPVLLSGSDLISSLLDMLPFLLPLSCESLPRVFSGLSLQRFSSMACFKASLYVGIPVSPEFSITSLSNDDLS
jgi:hypothetical protein